MLEEAHSLPDDIAALKAMVLSSRAEVAARDAELRNRDLLIEKLKHQLAGLRRQRFGATSEALDQLELGLEDEEIARSAEAVAAPAPASKRQPKRRPLPDHLPREETHSLATGRAVYRLRRPPQASRRGCDGGAGVHPGPLRGEAHPAPAPGLRRMRDASTRRRYRRGRSSVADPAPAFSRMCWSRSTAITCRSIASPASSPAMA